MGKPLSRVRLGYWLRLGSARAAAASPDAKAWFTAEGADVLGDTPDEFAVVVRADHAR